MCLDLRSPFFADTGGDSSVVLDALIRGRFGPCNVTTGLTACSLEIPELLSSRVLILSLRSSDATSCCVNALKLDMYSCMHE